MQWRLASSRSIDELHRSATPLELLFDLTLVVAVAQAAAELRTGSRRTTSARRSRRT